MLAPGKHGILIRFATLKEGGEGSLRMTKLIDFHDYSATLCNMQLIHSTFGPEEQFTDPGTEGFSFGSFCRTLPVDPMGGGLLGLL